MTLCREENDAQGAAGKRDGACKLRGSAGELLPMPDPPKQVGCAGKRRKTTGMPEQGVLAGIWPVCREVTSRSSVVGGSAGALVLRLWSERERVRQRVEISPRRSQKIEKREGGRNMMGEKRNTVAGQPLPLRQ